MADTTPPSLLSLRIPTDIDLSKGHAVLTIDGVATDDESGVYSVVIWLDKDLTESYSTTSPNFSRYSFLGIYSSIFTPWQNGDFSEDFLISRFNQNGGYGIKEITIKDRAGNEKKYSKQDIEALGINTAITLSGADTDTTPPLLKSINIPTSIDLKNGNAELQISAQATDEQSGVSRLEVKFDKNFSRSSSTTSPSFSSSAYLWIFGNSDSWADGASSEKYLVASTNSNSIYNISSITVTDMQGNQKSYTTTDLKSLGFNTAITLTGATTDVTSPTLTALQIPALINLAGGNAIFTISAKAADDLSGIKLLQISLNKPLSTSAAPPYAASFYSSSYISLTGESIYGSTDTWADGESSQSFVLNSTTPPGAYDISSVYLVDNQGNSSFYNKAQLANLGVNTSIYIDSSTKTTPPTIFVTASNPSLKAGETAVVTFNLSEPSSDFDSGDVAVTGGGLSNFAGAGNTYTARFTPNAGSIANGVISVASGKFSDAAGNLNVDGADANNRVTIAIDTVLPTISVTSSKTSLKGSESATISFALSEASNDFVAGDVSVSGGTLSDFTGSGAAYTAKFTPDSNSTANGIVSVASGKLSDAAGNQNADGADANNRVTLAVDTRGLPQVLSVKLDEPTQSLILTFSEPARLGSGYIFLRQGAPNGRIVESFRVESSDAISFSGNTATITPNVRLTPNLDYYLSGDRTTVSDLENNLVVDIGAAGPLRPKAVSTTALFDTFAGLANAASFDRIMYFSGSGLVKGVAVTMAGDLTRTLVGETSFENTKAFKYSLSGQTTYTVNGQSFQKTDGDSYSFYDRKYLQLGYVSTDSYEVVVDRTAYPDKFKIGDSFYEKSISYSDGSKKIVLETTTEKSSVVADTPGTALIQTEGTTVDSSEAIVSTSIDTVRITPAGGSQPVAISFVSADGETMTVSASLGASPKSGHVYHWKSHVLMGGVGFDVTTGTSSDTVAPRLIDFKNIRVDPFSGDVTAEVWAMASAAFGSVSLEFAHDSGLAFKFTADPTNLSDWQVVSNADVDSTVVMAMGLRQLSGYQRLGSILMAAGTDGVGTRLSLVDSMLGSTPVRDVNLAISNPSGEYWVGSSSGSRALSLSKSPTGDATNAVTAADALAALKIASRVNPNTDPDGPGSAEPAPVSPYQLIAADVNGNGRVDADDALSILKMALRRSDAPETEWWFMRENRDFFDESTGRFSTDRKNVPLQRSGESVELSSDVNWVAVLKGDVDGSWSPDRNEIESKIPEPVLRELASELGTSVAQWGLGPDFYGITLNPVVVD